MILTKFKNLLKFQKATTLSSRCYFSETDDSFYKQSFFTKSYTKPFTITTEENILSVNCVKGRFKQQQSYITLDKVGAMILDFIPVTKSTNEKESKQQLDVRGKKNFTLGVKQVGELLKYNPHDLRNSSIKLEFKYYAGSQHEHKKLLIQKNPKEELVTFNLTVTKQGNNVSFTTPVELGDFIIMQELCRYSLPYVLGWHIMNSPRIAEEEVNSTTPNSYENYN